MISLISISSSIRTTKPYSLLGRPQSLLPLLLSFDRVIKCQIPCSYHLIRVERFYLEHISRKHKRCTQYWVSLSFLLRNSRDNIEENGPSNFGIYEEVIDLLELGIDYCHLQTADHIGVVIFTWCRASTPRQCQQSLYSISLADATAISMFSHSIAKLKRLWHCAYP